MADMNELQMLAEQSPELRAALSELFATGDMQKFQADLLRQARIAKDTEQPGLIHTRDQTIAASPLNNIASTWKQVQGRMDERSIQQAMGDLIRKKSKTADDYNAFIQSQAQKHLAAQQAAALAAHAQANEGGGMAPQLQGGDGSGAPGQDMWHGEGRAPVVSGDPQSGPMHDFGPYPPPGARPVSPRPRGYMPFDYLRPGPARGNPWEE